MTREQNVEEIVHNFLELENVSVLVGTGLAKACGGKTMDEISQKLAKNLDDLNDPDIVKWKRSYLEGDSSNFEEFFNALNVKKKYLDLREESDQSLMKAISFGKEVVFEACTYTPNEEQAIPLFRFLRCLTERKAGLPRANIFSLNYDLLIEHACDELGILVNDGFEGSSKRYFNPAAFDLDFYHPSGAVNLRPTRCERVINLFKLHGSVSWQIHESKICKAKPCKENMFIYPSQDKLEDTLVNPFHELFRRFSISNRRYKNAIVIIGYGFLDSHVNNLLLQALEQPHSFLIVVDPKLDAWKLKCSALNKHLDKIQFINEKFEDFCEKYLPLSLTKDNVGKDINELAKKFIDAIKSTASDGKPPELDGDLV